ncbi:hypothetical protein [Streptomyces sp. NPDC058335]|uniref:hypothetical protein n=1 Tax=Streptomyces sp. NPDC058335 TaxID=3346451 RepID=UPI003649AFCC
MDNAAEELGRLREKLQSAFELFSADDVKSASETLESVVRHADEVIAALREAGATDAVTLPWDLDRAFALISQASLEFSEGNSRGVASSLRSVTEAISQIDLDAVADMAFGRCVHNRITSDDSRCQASPPC